MKGLDKLFDAILSFMEENPELIAEGFNQFVEDNQELVEQMIAERKVQSSASSTEETVGG